MEKTFLEETTATLTAQRKELIDALAANNAAFRQLAGASGEIGDTVDEASGTVDRKMLETIGAKDMNRLQLIDSALARIRQGKYGLCMKCGKSIPEERLRALPHALLCIKCKSEDERRNR
ncbi:MAG: TraR/DksA family transcriptional regulator [Treponema sp.]|nr:TraR/DksA family transcriptional regulator [Treponema sp.]